MFPLETKIIYADDDDDDVFCCCCCRIWHSFSIIYHGACQLGAAAKKEAKMQSSDFVSFFFFFSEKLVQCNYFSAVSSFSSFILPQTVFFCLEATRTQNQQQQKQQQQKMIN